jgi:hypothetical protein
MKKALDFITASDPIHVAESGYRSVPPPRRWLAASVQGL